MILPPELLVFLLAMAPFSEVRGAIPLGILVFKIPFWNVFLISFLGSTLSILIILLFLDPVSKFFSKYSKFFKKVFTWVCEKTRKKANRKIKKYKEWGIFVISATPLPLFGVWTGSLSAFLFDIPLKVAFPLIAFGNLLAIGIISVITISGFAVEEVFGWSTLFGVIVLVLLCWLFYHFFLRRKKGYSKIKNN